MMELQAVRTVGNEQATPSRSLLANIKKLWTLKAPTHPPSQSSSIVSTESSICSTVQDYTTSSQTTATSTLSLGPVDATDTEAPQHSVNHGIKDLITIGDNCFAMPAVGIAQSHLQTWEIDIEPRLRDEAFVRLGRSCQLEFCIVRDKFGKESPYILLICWDERLRNDLGTSSRVRRMIQKQVNRFQSLKNCPFPVKVVIDRVSLIAMRGSQKQMSENEAAATARLTEPSPNSPDGQPAPHLGLAGRATGNGWRERQAVKQFMNEVSIMIPQTISHECLSAALVQRAGDVSPICTLGGLVQLDQKLFGLTVAHPFRNENRISGITHDRPTVQDSSTIFDEVFEALSSEEDSIGSSADEDDGDIDDAQALSGTVEVDPRSFFGLKSVFSGTVVEMCELTHTQGDYHKQGFCCDWALIALDLPSFAGSDTDLLTGLTANGLKYRMKDQLTPGLHVIINKLQGTPLRGQLGQSNITLTSHEMQVKVTQIILAKPLEPGDSGSWVTAEGVVLGQIVATRTFAPIAYMVSMNSILDDLRDKFLPQTISIFAMANVLQLNPKEAVAGITQPRDNQDDHNDSSSVAETPESFADTKVQSEFPRRSLISFPRRLREDTGPLSRYDSTTTPMVSTSALASTSHRESPSADIDSVFLNIDHLLAEYRGDDLLDYEIPLKRLTFPTLDISTLPRYSLGQGLRSTINLEQPASIGSKAHSTQPAPHVVRDIAQEVAQNKGTIVTIRENVESDDIEGLKSRAAVHSVSVKNPPTSYYFPQDSRNADWKPMSVSVAFCQFLIILAVLLAATQEYICQLSLQTTKLDRPKPKLVLSALSNVIYLPFISGFMYATLFSIMDLDICRLEPYYRLSQRSGCRSAESLELEYFSSSQFRRLKTALRFEHWIVASSSIGGILVWAIVPFLQSMAFYFTKSELTTCPTGEECQPGHPIIGIRVNPSVSRMISSVYLAVALITTLILVLQRKRKSGLISDPKGIARIVSMATSSHVLQDLKGADVATHREISKRLSHRSYTMWRATIWQGEWKSDQHVYEDGNNNIEPHPAVLKLSAMIPLVLGLLLFLLMIPTMKSTRTLGLILAKVPWIVLLPAIATRYVWSQIEANIRLLEPYYQLARGNAKPEESLTLDYQATIYGYLPILAACRGHYMVAAASSGLVCLDIICLVATAFSIRTENNSPLTGSGAQEFVIEPIPSTSTTILMLLLGFMVLITVFICVNRHQTFLPRTPSNIASILAYVYSSKMLYDFIDSNQLTSQRIEERLKASRKTYGFGWFTGRDGSAHCGIEEEPLTSRYDHGFSYNRALAPSMTSYEFV